MAFGAFGKRKKETENWPKKDNGEPVSPAFLKHIGGSQMDIELMLSLLQAYNIPAVSQYPNNGAFGRVLLGHAGGGVDLYVPETMLAEARDIISAEVVRDGDAEETQDK